VTGLIWYDELKKHKTPPRKKTKENQRTWDRSKCTRHE